MTVGNDKVFDHRFVCSKLVVPTFFSSIMSDCLCFAVKFADCCVENRARMLEHRAYSSDDDRGRIGECYVNLL